MDRIITDPRILAGKPVIKGTRIPVYLILNLIGRGKTIREITQDYPELTEVDVKAAISYAASITKYEETKSIKAS